MSEAEAADLIRRLHAGDRGAAGSYYDRYFEAMFAEAQAVFGPDESACLDVVQDAMLKVIHSPPKPAAAAYLEAWSRRVAKTVAIDRLRAESRRARREATAADRAAGSAPPPYPDDDQLPERVRKLLGAADAAARDLLRWRYLDGLTLREIGLRLGLKTGAVDGRLRRAVASLRHPAREEFGDDFA